MQSLERCLNVLNCIAKNSQHMTLDELTKATCLNKATCYRLLQSLKDLNFVKKDENSKKYRLGNTLIGLGLAALSDLNLIKLATPVMENLKKDTKENVNLAIINNLEILFVKRIQSDYLMNVHHRVGSRFPIYCSSLGKVLLAYLPQSQREMILQKLELKKFTPKTYTSIGSFKKELSKIREQGFAASNEEMEKGLLAVAAPIRDYTGFPVAAIGLSYATIRYDESEYFSIFSEKILEAAKKISTSLGFTNSERRY